MLRVGRYERLVESLERFYPEGRVQYVCGDMSAQNVMAE